MTNIIKSSVAFRSCLVAATVGVVTLAVLTFSTISFALLPITRTEHSDEDSRKQQSIVSQAYTPDAIRPAPIPYAIAVNSSAFLVSEAEGQVDLIGLRVSQPVFKVFGLSKDRQRLLYSPLRNGSPSGELILEDLTNGSAFRVTDRVVLEAAFSPADDALVAFTFSGNASFGLGISDINNRISRVVQSSGVYPSILAWNRSGSKIHFYDVSNEPVTEDISSYFPEPAFKNLAFWNRSADKKARISEPTSRLIKRVVSIKDNLVDGSVPEGFPELSNSVSFQTGVGSSDLYAKDSFRVQIHHPRIEIAGESIRGTGKLALVDNAADSAVVIDDAQLVKALSHGMIVRQFAGSETILKWVDWSGGESVLGSTSVTYQLPMQSAVMTQGGASFPSPGNCGITAHAGHMGHAYDFQKTVVGSHVMATAGGLVVYAESSVTCNSVEPTCPDYSATNCPGSFLGNVLIIQHADGTYSKYAHMETNSPQVAVGTVVEQGLYIGRQGHTGSTGGSFNSCGDHLHFQRQITPDLFGQSVDIDFSEVAVEPLSCGVTYNSASTEFSHSISPVSRTIGFSGGPGTVNVVSTGGTWTAVTNTPWITVTDPGAGNGNSMVAYDVQDNSNGSPRTGTINIGGHLFTISQAGSQPANQPPTVDAGSDQMILSPAPAQLTGIASDDGVPSPPGSLNVSWTKVSGPGNVVFSDQHSLATNAQFSMAGEYLLRLTATDGDLTSSDDIRITVNISNAGGALSGNRSSSPSQVDLTSEGSADWAHWGLVDADTYTHKNTVSRSISDYEYIGNTSVLRFTGNATSYAWTDGSVVPSTFTDSGVFTYGIGNGFRLTVPADPTPRTLKLHVGHWSAGGRLVAMLSDGSASPFVDTTLLSTSGGGLAIYSLSYRSASPGQVLDIYWTIESSYHSIGNITLQAATLVDDSLPANQAPNVDAGPDSSVLFPADAVLAGTVTDDGLPLPPSLSSAWSVVSGPGQVVFGDSNSSATTASFNSPGTYVLRLTASDGSLAASDEMTVSVNSPGQGVLTVASGVTPTGAVNLSAEGTTDWAHWGLSGTSFNHKSGVTPQISNYTHLGGGTVQQFTGNSTNYNWTGGSPTPTAGNVDTGLWVTGMNSGYQITVPADTNPRTLKMYVGLWAAGGRFEASLSDGSAPIYVDTSVLNATATSNRIYTLHYQAASPGQTLTVKWTVNTTFNAWSNVTLQAATLTGGVVPTPTPTPVNLPPSLDAGSDQLITLPDQATLSALYAYDDGMPGPLTLTWTKASGPGNVTFGSPNAINTTASFSTPGTYTLMLSAYDGALTSTDILNVSVHPQGTGSIYAYSFPPLEPSEIFDLSAEGPADWVHWGSTGVASVNRKSVSGSMISDFQQIGTGTIESYPGDISENRSIYRWSDGSPLISEPGTSFGVKTTTLNNGFQLSAPADTSERTLRVHVGLSAARGRFSATMSDGSIPVYVDTSQVSPSLAYDRVYVIRYRAGSAGQSLTVTWTMEMAYSTASLVSLHAATVTGPPVTAPASGALSVASGVTPTGVNLSAEGTADWAHWGLSGLSFNHKSGVTQQISNYTQLGGGTIKQFTGNSTSFTWTGGAPTLTAGSVTTGVSTTDIDTGFQITAPADTTARRLKVYVGVQAAGGRFEASLSDGSAPFYVDTSLINASGVTNRVYTLNYKAASPGQTITVKWTVNSAFDSSGGISVQGATLRGGVAPPIQTSSEFQISSPDPVYQLATHIAMANDNSFVAVWQADHLDGNAKGIFARLYSSNGVPLTAPFLVNTFTAGNQFVAKAAIDGSGNIIIVWESDGVDGSAFGVSARRFSPNGVPLTPEFQVNTTTAENQYNPYIASSADGSFVVTWSSYLQDGSGSGIYAQRFGPNGTPIGSEFRVSSHTPNDQERSRVWIDPFGRFTVTWESREQDGSGWGAYARRFDVDGTPLSAEFRLNSSTVGDQYWTSVSGDAVGNTITTWSSNHNGDFDIYARRFDPNGVPIGDEFRVNSFIANDQLFPAVSSDPSGNSIIVWQSDGADGSGIGVSGQRLSSGGAILGPEFSVNSFTAGAQGAPWVSKGQSGRFVVIWSSLYQSVPEWAVFGRRYDAAGNPLSAP